MMRNSLKLLSFASILAFRFLSISQRGVWEISPGTISLAFINLLISTLVFFISIVVLVRSTSFNIIALRFKIVYYTWIAIIIGIYILGYSYEIWSINYTLKQIFKYAFIIGAVLSITLHIILEFGIIKATLGKFENKMLISQILFFGASILAFEFLDIARRGSEIDIIREGNVILLVSTILFFGSIVFLFKSKESFNKISLPFMVTYFFWMAIIVLIYIAGWSQSIYNWPYAAETFQYSFMVGSFISLGIQILMEFGNRRAFNDY